MSEQLGKSYPLPSDKLPTLSLMLRDDGTPGAALDCDSFNPFGSPLPTGERHSCTPPVTAATAIPAA